MADFNPHKKGFIAEINVTPFVDVMLVLLIIFMVTAPLMTQGLEVDLPQTKTVRTLPKDKDHMVLTIRADGTIYLDEYKVPQGELGGHLQRLVKAENKFLYIRADKAVAYGVVVGVMGEVKSAGIDRLGVVAEPEDTRPARPGEK
ncbi:protein TolR [Desulfobaculum senezii]